MCRSTLLPPGQVEAVEQVTADLVLFFHHRHGLGLVDGGAPRAAAFGVGGERLLQFVGEPQVVHHQPARLVAEDAVHPGDSLHQPVGAHGLVQIHGVEARTVKAREPHVADDDDLEGVLRVAKSVCQKLPARLVADVELPLDRVRGRARHHDLDLALVVVVVPVGTEAHDLVVELDADPPAHADHHGLAVQGPEALFEVAHDVLGHEAQALLRPDHRLELRPLGLELLLALDLLVLGDLLELLVDPRLQLLRKVELGQPALVVDGHGGLVLDRPLDVVDRDVVAEHRAGVTILKLQGRTREPDEACIGQGVAHVAGEAVDEVVLAAVRLVGDHHNVASVRQCRGNLCGRPVLGRHNACPYIR
jgi:hypothetical protein